MDGGGVGGGGGASMTKPDSASTATDASSQWEQYSRSLTLLLLSALGPTAPGGRRPNDKDIVRRNDKDDATPHHKPHHRAQLQLRA